MSKAKGKGGTGRGTGKKGWNRWQAGAKKAKSAKPYKSKGVKHNKDSGTEQEQNKTGRADKARPFLLIRQILTDQLCVAQKLFISNAADGNLILVRMKFPFQLHNKNIMCRKGENNG